MSTEGPFWERHLGHMEETAYYGHELNLWKYGYVKIRDKNNEKTRKRITTVAYFVAVMFGFGKLGFGVKPFLYRFFANNFHFSAYQWVLLKSDSDTRMAGINVSIFFIVIQELG